MIYTVHNDRHKLPRNEANFMHWLNERLKMEKYINEHSRECYRGVKPDTPFSELEFHEVTGQMDTDEQWALHTNLGTLTVLDRLTGFEGGIRDTETGYRDPDGKFWLASCHNDVRKSGATTMQDAIDWVKERANTCVGI